MAFHNRIFILIAGIGLSLLTTAGQASTGSMYVYELPSGARIVTDHRLTNKYYRLIREGASVKGIGHLAASGESQFFRTDPDAYDDLIRQVARDHEVEFALVKAIVHAESGFNPYARSKKGALGLMQLLPSTAKQYGVDDMYDPAENIRAGVQHIKYLLKLFSHKHYLVVAAYNAGENAVKRHRGIPPYRETQAYV
jgi:membrane-bound lytic murein transglycosylase MltF